MGAVAAATGARFAVKAHGSELEYSMRGNPELAMLGREALAGAKPIFVGSAHTGGAGGRRRPRRSGRVPPGVDVEEFAPASATMRSGACSWRPGRPAESRQRERATPRRGQRGPARRVLRSTTSRPSSSSGSSSTTRASTSSSRPCAKSARARSSSASGTIGASWSARRRRNALHRCPRASPPGQPGASHRR